MTSLVLGTVGVLLSFLPILGLPISAFGVLFGILGLIGVLLGGGAALRWSVAGLILSALALAINVALFYAPSTNLMDREVPKRPQLVSDRPFVPPPAP
jgi:hypothetical protein